MRKILEAVATVSKAVAAAAAAGVSTYAGAQVAGSIGPVEWLTVAAAVLGAFVITYGAPRNAT